MRKQQFTWKCTKCSHDRAKSPHDADADETCDVCRLFGGPCLSYVDKLVADEWQKLKNKMKPQ